jgi:ASC-1-like (ASCH) protein
MPFSMEWMRDRYLVMMRSGLARIDGRFESAITFDRTIVSRSNFYWSFRMPFFMQWMRDRYLVMMRSGRARFDGRVERP